MKQDVYQKVTDKIIADLEQGELTWLKPWSAGNMDGRIIKPLRHNGMAYSGINADILGDHPLFVGNQPISYSIWHQNGNADIEAGYEFANSTEDELEALVVEIAEVEGWGEPASEFTDRYNIPSNGAQVRFSTIETERNSTAKAFITFGF